ncbi:hypothetical protein J6590_010409 [Homalodisca vitripennis]|nr:hypothetical protein J6590_010409 [Homalodisca vitripennis]
MEMTQDAKVVHEIFKINCNNVRGESYYGPIVDRSLGEGSHNSSLCEVAAALAINAPPPPSGVWADILLGPQQVSAPPQPQLYVRREQNICSRTSCSCCSGHSFEPTTMLLTHVGRASSAQRSRLPKRLWRFYYVKKRN